MYRQEIHTQSRPGCRAGTGQFGQEKTLARLKYLTESSRSNWVRLSGLCKGLRMADRAGSELPPKPADGLAPAVPPNLEARSTPEITVPMLEVHPPYESIHTWKSFFIHIATIVIGLLIAVTLEQTVEFFHHHHQRYELGEALRRNGEGNRQYIKDDLVVAQGTLDWALEQIAIVEGAGATGNVTIRRMPAGFIYAPDDGVWISAKASGLTSLLPAAAQNWYEDMDDRERAIFDSTTGGTTLLNAAFSALDQAIGAHAVETSAGDLDLSALTAAQRATIVDRTQAIVAQVRNVMRQLVSYSNDNEYILQTPFDKLDDVNDSKRFYEIASKNRAAHPGIRFIFSPK
jgi:hypothetical protein